MSQVTLHTNHGAIEIELFDDDAPKTVENFLRLSREGFYDGLIFHRVIPGFMIQGGDPKGTGSGGPGYQFEDEINQHKIVRGPSPWPTPGRTRTGASSSWSQPRPRRGWDGKHTVFGQVTSGMEAVDSIEGTPTGPRDRPVDDATIERVEVHEA
jgi:peptidyl-prolyl cis-trans isomerase B (cyclophilin B)